MKAVVIIGTALLLSACAQTSVVQMASKERAGFDTVQAGASRAVGASPEWALSAGEIEALDRRVHGLVHKKTINADTAVQVAIMNNRGLQASFADLATMLPLPRLPSFRAAASGMSASSGASACPCWRPANWCLQGRS